MIFKLLLILLISFLLYSPSLFNFFSHDDFFHLKISRAENLADFVNFFNLITAPEGFGHFRPLTTQVFYSLSYIFNLNPISLHIISFIAFFAVIFLVYKTINVILKDGKTSLIGAFLYGTSSIHFGHLYYLGAFQELGFALFFFAGNLAFIKYLRTGRIRYGVLTTLAFMGTLLSKESAVIFLPTLMLVYFFVKFKESIKPKKFSLASFLVLNSLFLILYLYLHTFYYGFAKGDSYIWDFSTKVLNTIFWYGLWSFNLPEMLVDFVGPGFNVNPNLMKYYGREIIPIVVLFALLLLILCFALFQSLRGAQRRSNLLLFSIIWFLLTLLPYSFLPWHKFTFELTVPLFGIVLALSLLLRLSNKKLTVIFLFTWFTLSLLTNILTYKTHWIVSGGRAAHEVKQYIDKNYLSLVGKQIIFYDTELDKMLPWSPSQVLSQTLSGKNFFEVLYEGKIKVYYETKEEEDFTRLKSRDFLNY